MGQRRFLPATPDVLAEYRFERYFSPRLDFGRYCWNLMLLSVASIVPFLVVFVLHTPDFATTLIHYPAAASRFLRQVFTNGIPVVFIVNYVGFLLAVHGKQCEQMSAAVYLASDSAVRALTFVAMHILIYVLSADWFGSFGGNRLTALKVVGPTLSKSYLFESISGVYLYALLPGAIISHLAVIANKQKDLQRRRQSLPVAPILVAVIGLVLLVTVYSSGLSRLFGTDGPASNL